MWYHAIAYYGAKRRYWWNRKRDDLIQDVLTPFVSKQVRILNREGVPSLFNFGAAEYLTVVKTNGKLVPKASRMPSELAKKEFVAEHCATKEFMEEMQELLASPKTKSLLEQAVATPRHQVFVVMQFGDEQLDSAYVGVIKPIAREFNFEVVRVDEIQNSGNISQQILESISASAVVIADLTGERPNCYYEAGFAHAIGKEIIFSIREGTKIHFDLAGNRFINWRTEADYRVKLRERFESITSKGDGSR